MPAAASTRRLAVTFALPLAVLWIAGAFGVAAAQTPSAETGPAAAAAASAAAAVAPDAIAETAAAPTPTRQRPEPAIERRVIEDDGVRIEELRVRGQVVRVTVQSKVAGAPPYEVNVGAGGRDPSQERGRAGQSAWRLFSF